MSYELPAPPASGVVADPDGIVWQSDGVTWRATCQTCHTPLTPMTWPHLLAEKVTLEDVPGGMSALAAEEPA